MRTLRDLVMNAFFTGAMFYGLLNSLYKHDLFLTIMFTVFFTIDIAATISNYDKVKQNN
jgi:hypothetical protein